MKYDILRSCKHSERVKVYELDPHRPKESKEHTEHVLMREGWKRCTKCRRPLA